MSRRTIIFLSALVGGLVSWAVFATFFRVGEPVSLVPSAAAETLSEHQSLDSALRVQEAFRYVSAAVLPSIVEISVETENAHVEGENGEIPWNDFFSDPDGDSPAPRFYRSQGLGSGVIVAAEGSQYYVLTNAHVVGENPSDISVETFRGLLEKASLIGTDSRKDLALVRFESDDNELKPITLGDSDKLYVGDWVLAFGSPYGYEQSVSSGIVSALGRRDGPGENINDFIQTDASINQGNSGGALVNIKGELVGINTFITTPNGGSIGLGFAIPVNNAMSSVRQLMENGEIIYGWLGVSLGAYGVEAAESLGYPQKGGGLVYQVFDSSPAWYAGLRPGDLVTAMDGVEVTGADNLIYRIGEKSPGEQVRFTVNRFGKTMELVADIGERGDADAVSALHGSAYPGFVAAPLTADLMDAMNLSENIGVPVAEVYPRTRAQMAGLLAGDLIIAVGNLPVLDLKTLYMNLAISDTDDPGYTVLRDGEEIELTINREGIQ